MAVAMRLQRGGQKKRPYYKIIVADRRMPRDGRFIEQVGTYNPMLAKGDENRVTLVKERVEYWLKEGALPSDRVMSFLAHAGMAEKPDVSHKPQKPRKRADKKSRKEVRAENEAEAKANAEAEAEAAKNAPAEEPAAEEPKAEAPAEEAPAAEPEAAAEEAKAE